MAEPLDREPSAVGSPVGQVGGVVAALVDDDVVAAAEESAEASKQIQGRSPWRLALERLRRDRASLISAVVILLVILLAILAPVIAHLTGHGPNQQFRDIGEDIYGAPTGPGKHFLLGADDQGRDVLVRIAYGARVSLLIGVVATLLTVAVGVLFGLMAGFLGRLVDTVISRIIDVTLSIPFLLFAIALASVEGGGGIAIVIIVLVVFGFSSVARIVRGQVLSIREREYVEAARSLGASSFRIMFVDILPNVLAQVIVYATLLIPLNIVTEATLSYLGVGVQHPTADWGQMISDAQAGNLYQQAWWFLVFPSLALLITTLAFNIFGDGVRDAFDPRADRMFV